MESENRICSLNCDKCPAHTPGIFAPTTCQVLNAVIDAYGAQEAYWRQKMEIEERGLQSQADDIGKRRGSVERKLKDSVSTSSDTFVPWEFAEKKLKDRPRKTRQGKSG